MWEGLVRQSNRKIFTKHSQVQQTQERKRCAANYSELCDLFLGLYYTCIQNAATPKWGAWKCGRPASNKMHKSGPLSCKLSEANIFKFPTMLTPILMPSCLPQRLKRAQEISDYNWFAFRFTSFIDERNFDWHHWCFITWIIRFYKYLFKIFRNKL